MSSEINNGTLGRFLITEQEEEPQSWPKAASGLGKISSVIAKGFNKMDDYVRQDYCEKISTPLKGQDGNIQTWGDLHALLKCGSEYKNRKEVLSTLTFVPGVSAALDIIQKSGEIRTLLVRIR